MPSRAPSLTLLEANTALHTNSRTHAAVIVVKPRDAPSIERNRLWPVIVPPAAVATVDLWALKQALQSNARSRRPR